MEQLPEANTLYNQEQIRKLIPSKTSFVHKMSLQGGYLLPPAKHISWRYIGQIMRGEKLLVPLSSVRMFHPPPKIKELSTSRIWPNLRNNEDILKYLPDFKPNKTPPRSYLFQVLSAVFPGELQTLLEETREQRERMQLVTKEFEVCSQVKDILERDEDYFTYLKKEKSHHFLYSGRRFRGWN